MFKPQWFDSKKKIFIPKNILYISLVSTMILIVCKTIIFLIVYLDGNKWKEIVDMHNKSNESFTSVSSTMRIRYLISYWSVVGVALLFIVMVTIGYSKKEMGFLFVTLWVIIWTAIIGVNAWIMKDNGWQSVITITPIVPVIIALGMFTINLRKHRSQLYIEYVARVRKGME